MHGAKIQATVHVVHPTNSSERIKREKVSHLYCAYRAALTSARRMLRRLHKYGCSRRALVECFGHIQLRG